MRDSGADDGLYLADDDSDEPCQANLYGFCRWCGRDMDVSR